MLLLIVGLILFISLVVVHELGHFWVARRNGVDAEEFGIFFPPTLWRKKMKGGWDFTINLLPLGGFVKLKGEYDEDRRPGAFGAATTWVKTKIMLAGVVVNLVVAVLLFTILALTGMPKLVNNQFTVASDTKIIRQDVYVGSVTAGSPAAKAGLKSQDKITTITGEQGKSYSIGKSDLSTVTRTLAGQTVTIDFVRNGHAKTVAAKLNTEKAVTDSIAAGSPKGYLGVAHVENIVVRSTWSAPIVAVGVTGQFTKMTLQGLWSALRGLGSIIAATITGNTVARQHGQTAASEQVSGPVGIFMILKSGSVLGFSYILMIIALISLTLAIMNILPIPALDGGRVFVMMVARLLKKPLTRQIEERVYGAGFIALILLIIVITIVDVKRFF